MNPANLVLPVINPLEQVPYTSPSAARDYLLCPHRYALGHWGIPQTFQDKLHIGNAIHAVAAYGLEHFKTQALLPARAILERELERHLVQVPAEVTGPRLGLIKREAHYLFEVLLEVLGLIVERYQVASVEEWVNLRTQDAEGEVQLSGRLDALLYDPEQNRFLVYDFKCSTFEEHYADLSPLALYVAHARARYGQEVSVTAYGVYLEGQTRYVPYDLDHFENDLEKLAQTARAAYTDHVFPKREGQHCEYCPFLEMCQSE